MGPRIIFKILNIVSDDQATNYGELAVNRGVDPWIYYTLRYYKIGPLWGPPRALGLLGPTKPSQNQLTYTFQHQPDTSQPFPWQHKMFPSSGIFSQFQGNCFHVFPGHFSAPTDLPSRLFLPYEVDTYFPTPKDHDQPTLLATIGR